MEAIGQKVRAARTNAGLSQRELAERVPDLDHSALSRIETGQRRVASHELFALAEALDTTTGELLGTPQKSNALAVAARLGAVAHPQYMEAAIARVTQVLEIDDLLTRLTGGGSTVVLDVRTPKAGPAAAQGRLLAVAARSALGAGTGPLFDLAQVLEERVGAHVVAQPIAGDVHGLCVSDGNTAVVLVNTNDRWSRQRFTLAHELGHLLVRDLELYEVTGMALPGDDVSERRANSFAAHFLAPDDGIRNVVGTRTVDAAVVAELIDYFGMSLEAMTWRLVDLDLLPRAEAEALQAGGLRAVIAASDLGSVFSRRADMEGARLAPQRLLRRTIDAYRKGEVGLGMVASVLGEADVAVVRQQLEGAGVGRPDVGVRDGSDLA